MSAECVAESIPAGYKQTEVGVIPEDWEVKRLVSVCSMKSGEGITSADIDEYSPFPCYGGNGLRGFTKHYTHDGSYALIGRQGALCGNVLGVAGKFFASEHAVVVTPFPQTDIIWLKFVLRNLNLNQYSESSAQPGLSVSKLSDLPLAFPSTLAEQEAIATALSDTDALIESLEQLIAKKRQVKQGAMQELLTCKRRLPGFSGEWKMKILGEIVEIRSGGTPSTTQPQFWDGDIFWCTPTDITALNGYKYLGETSRQITLEGLKCSSAEMIPSKSIVMTSRATIGECAINRVPVSTNQGFKNLIPSENVDVEFLYYLLLTKKQEFISLCGGSTFLEIGKTQLFMFEVELPSSKEEQVAIAAILSDMDAEITTLEEKLVKTRQIKQGMMQELLTGRIRLV